MRFFRSVTNGIVWGIFGAIAVTGLFAFGLLFAEPRRFFAENPSEGIPLFDAILLIAAPIVGFLVAGITEFWWTWKEHSVQRHNYSPRWE